ncbi:type 4a pilus biogenesis protein PilO [Candidatus Uhrbacteria bacterium]|nr:type 4a pilus biogenesis protein PilO [Candidatus Uhrbacteria bacterium]
MRTHPVLLGCAFAFLLGAGGWFFLLQPTSNNLAAARAAHTTLTAEYDRLREAEAAADRLTKEVSRVRPEEFEKMSRIVPSGRDVPRLIVELESLASETGILLKDVGLGEERESSAKDLPKGVHAIDLVVTVTGGDYATLKRFLEAIEKNVRLLDVQSFMFSKGLQSYSINLRAYYR